MNSEPYSKGWGNQTRSQLRQGIGKGEDVALAILTANHVRFDYNLPLPTPFRDGKDRPITLKPDFRIHGDERFKDGIIEIDGKSHASRGSTRWDAEKDAMYAEMGLWAERLEPGQAAGVMALLEGHRK